MEFESEPVERTNSERALRAETLNVIGTEKAGTGKKLN